MKRHALWLTSLPIPGLHLNKQEFSDMSRLFAIVLLAGAMTLGCSGSSKLNQNNAGGDNGPANSGKAGTSGGMPARQATSGASSGQSGSADASGGTTSSGAAGNGTGTSAESSNASDTGSTSRQSGTNKAKQSPRPNAAQSQ
jgi:hypothetical protein